MSSKVSSRRKIAAVASAAIIVAALVSIGLFAKARQREGLSRSLANKAMIALQSDPELALLLSVEAASKSPTSEARDALIQALSGPRLCAELRGDADGLNGASFSPDGKYVLTAGKRDTLQVWEAETGKLVSKMGLESPVLTAEFSPDSKYIMTSNMTANYESRIRVWEISSGHETKSYPSHATNGDDFFTPDGRFATVTNADFSLAVIDSQENQVVTTIPVAAAADNIRAFSPDGAILLVQYMLIDKHDGGGNIKGWEIATGKQIESFAGDLISSRLGSAPFDFAFSPDGRLIAINNKDDKLEVWELRTHKKIVESDSKAERAIFSAEGGLFAAVGTDLTTHVWDVSKWHALTTLYRGNDSVSSFSGDGNGIRGIQFSHDGGSIITAGVDHIARIWDVRTGWEIAELRGQQGALNVAMFSRDGRLALTTSDDNTARVWALNTTASPGELNGHSATIRAVSFSPAGGIALTSSDDSSVRIWDVNKRSTTTVLSGHVGPVNDAQFSSDGKLVVTAGADHTTRVWESQTGKQVAQIADGTSVLSHVVFSPDGRYILGIRSNDFSTRLWEVSSGRVIATSHNQSGIWTIKMARFTPDSKLVVMGDSENLACVYETNTGRMVKDLSIEGVSDAAFSPDNKFLVTAAGFKPAAVWKVGTWQQVLQLIGHSASIDFVAYSPNGQQILTSDLNAIAHIWDALTGVELIALQGKPGSGLEGQYKAEFSHNGDFVFMRNTDDELRILQASGSGLLLADIGDRTLKINRFSGSALSPDGKTVLVANGAKVLIYSCELCGSIDELIILGRARVKRSLTDNERRKFLN